MVQIKDKETGVTLQCVEADTLAGASLPYADLFGADLRGADLRRADLHGARLIQADLSGAELAGADLTHSWLWGASFAGARHLADASLAGAVYDSTTCWPQGFDPRERGAILGGHEPPSLQGFAPHAEVEIAFLRPEEGGRRTPCGGSYRPVFYYDGQQWIAFYAFSTDGWIRPGETVSALVHFLSPDAHVGRLYPGKEFELRDGAHVVARGHVTRVLGLADA